MTSESPKKVLDGLQNAIESAQYVQFVWLEKLRAANGPLKDGFVKYLLHWSIKAMNKTEQK